MKALKTAVTVVLLLSLTGILIWQQAQIKHLAAESAALREQLAQALSAQEQSEPLAKVQPNLAQHNEEAPSSELLRLRGEVGVLRRQLAAAVKPHSLGKLTPTTADLEPAARPQPPSKADLEASDAQLKATEQELVAAKQKLADLLAALSVPQEISKLDEAAALGLEDLKPYRSYFEAKRELGELERFAQVMRAKVRQEHLEAGDPLPGDASQ